MDYAQAQDLINRLNESFSIFTSDLKELQSEKPTLRDQFAMAALTGMLSSEVIISRAIEQAKKDGIEKLTPIFAQAAYEQADTMMEARNVKK